MTDAPDKAALADYIETSGMMGFYLDECEKTLVVAALRSADGTRTCATCHAVLADGRQPAMTYSADGMREAREWAASRWTSEVANRPLQNIHRRSLDTTWRQVIRHFGGNDIELCGPPHDELAALAAPSVKTSGQ